MRPPLAIAGHTVRALTAADAPTLQAVLAQDPGYFESVERAPMRRDEAAEILAERPPGVPPARKHDYLVDGAALLSFVEGYPDATTWYLGLIFIAPAARGAGLGTRALEALAAYARAAGGTALRVAVAIHNPGARRLYDRLGFAFVARRTRIAWNGAAQDVDVLERAL